MKEFASHINNILKDHGFPHKKVTLPTDKLFEAAEERGFSLNSVLDHMRAELKIESEIGPDKILFSPIVNEENLFAQAQEAMSKMTPEQIEQMRNMVMNMSPEEREEMMKKGRDMGLI